MVAVKAHSNQSYDEIFPYEKHLDDVVDVLKRFGFSGKFIVAGYLHDSIEDDGISFNDIKKHFGVDIARWFSLMAGFSVMRASYTSHGSEGIFTTEREVSQTLFTFEIAETTFDPQKISDLYSNIVADGIFDTPLRYDYLARPVKLIPNTLAAMPVISADLMTYTLKVKPGIYFADDEALQMTRTVDPRTGELTVTQMKPAPGVEGAEYIAVCLPAFSPTTVHRD